MSEISEQRLEYELVMGRISDATWYRICKSFSENKLELTTKNIRMYIEFRKATAKTAVSLTKHLKAFVEASELVDKCKTSTTGEEILNLLLKYGVRPHRTTITRWFKPLGGFKKKSIYAKDEVRHVMSTAFVYRAEQMQKLKRPID